MTTRRGALALVVAAGLGGAVGYVAQPTPEPTIVVDRLPDSLPLAMPETMTPASDPEPAPVVNVLPAPACPPTPRKVTHQVETEYFAHLAREGVLAETRHVVRDTP